MRVDAPVSEDLRRFVANAIMTSPGRNWIDFSDAAIKAYRNHPETLAGDIRVANLFRLLCLYREAVAIDVTMEGPVFKGVNGSALRRAWEAEKQLGFGGEPSP